MRILITGGNGYIAKSIYSALCKKHDVTLVTKNDLNLTYRHKVEHYFSNKYFDLIIHTAVSGGNRLSLDNPEVTLTNLLMYDNLMNCRNKFNKLIQNG